MSQRIGVSVCDRRFDIELATLGRQLGADGYILALPDLATDPSTGAWSVAALRAAKAQCADAGLPLRAIENVPLHAMNDIVTGGPDRERQIAYYIQTVKNMGEAGIPILGVYFAPDGVWRTSFQAPGRGGALVSRFRLSTAATEGNQIAGSPTPGPVSSDDLWRNYERFLDEVLPVAEVAGVRLAQHPDDPPIGRVDVSDRIFTDIAAFTRAHAMAAGSPAWSVQLCLGTVAETARGEDEVNDFIDYFGTRHAIAYAHLRNVAGEPTDFVETFVNEPGRYSVARALRRLRDVGFDGWVQDDHVPAVAGDTPYGHRARAHAIGYLQGVLDAMEDER
jgi:mannonate dehydratase